jgi:hypothetical protein
VKKFPSEFVAGVPVLEIPRGDPDNEFWVMEMAFVD